MLRAWFKIALWKRILAALVAGVIVGMLWGPGSESIGWMGDVFMRLIRMVVVPLVFVTLVSGVVSMGDPSKLGSLGVKTLSIYMATTLGAITIGLIMAVILQPGVGVDLMLAAQQGQLQRAVRTFHRSHGLLPGGEQGHHTQQGKLSSTRVWNRSRLCCSAPMPPRSTTTSPQAAPAPPSSGSGQ